MVGPCGFESQTSAVSIPPALAALKREMQGLLAPQEPAAELVFQGRPLPQSGETQKLEVTALASRTAVSRTH